MGKQLPGMQSPMPGGVTPGQPPQRGALGSLGGGRVMGGGQQAPMVARHVMPPMQSQQPMVAQPMMPSMPRSVAQNLGASNREFQDYQAQMALQQQMQAPTFAPNDPRYAFGPGGQQQRQSLFMQQQQMPNQAAQAQQIYALNQQLQALGRPGMLGFSPEQMQQSLNQVGGQASQKQLPTQTGAQQLQQQLMTQPQAPQQPAFNPTQAMISFSADLARRVKSGAMTAQQAQQAQSQFRNQVQLNTQTPQTHQGAEAAARNIMQGVMAPPPPPGFNMGGEAMEDPRMQAMRYIQQLANQQRG
jgi:hypothetical protein